MGKIKRLDMNNDYIEQRLGTMINADTIEGLSLQGMSPSMKQAGLTFVPDIFKAMLFNALGETIYQCVDCGIDNKVVTGQGNFQSQKYLMEQLAEWVPMLKTLNLHANVGRVSIPESVLDKDEDIEVYRDVISNLKRMGMSKVAMNAIYDDI